MKAWRYFVIWLLFVPGAWATPNFSIEFSVGDLQQDGIALKGIQIKLQQGTKQQIRIRVAKAVFAQHQFNDLELTCPDAQGFWPTIACEKALLTAAKTPWGKQRIRLNIQMTSAQDWRIDWRGLSYASDKLRGNIQMQNAQWDLNLKAKAIQLARSAELNTLRKQLDLAVLQGQLAANLRLRGQGSALKRIDLNGRLKKVTGNNAAGSLALENVAANFNLSAKQVAKNWRGAIKLSSKAGQIYKEPIFFDFTQQPVEAILDGRLQTVPLKMNAKKIWLDAGTTIQLDAAGEFTMNRAIKGHANLKANELQATYATLIQPWLIGSALDDMTIQGQTNLDVRWRDNALTALDAELSQVSIKQSADKFALNNINADLHWREKKLAQKSRFNWSNGHFAGLDFGALDMHVQARGNQFELLNKVQIPFYQGKLELSDAVWVHKPNNPQLKLTAAINQVSLHDMSTDADLGWPVLSGRISGIIPGMNYSDDQLALDGDIKMSVFDGELSLNKLTIDALTSAAPVLQTDIKIRALNLAKLTEAFELGEMQGGLDGEIGDLQLIGWQPNRFKAHLYSPADDPLSHRISQRAVDHLTELGQGASGALSSTFLRFFDSFAYDELSLKLNQRGAVVDIDGIPHESGGYYLVKGAGIPSVDVIGHNRQVAWKTLLERVKRMQNK